MPTAAVAAVDTPSSSSPDRPDPAESIPPRWLVWRGAAAVLFGVLAMALPFATLASLLLVFAAWLLLEGTATLVAGFRARRRGTAWKTTVLAGSAHLLAGVLAVLLPGATLLAVLWTFAAWSIAVGVLVIASALRARRTPGRWWRVVGGALSIVWGVLLVILPFAGALAMTVWLGAYALVFGIGLLVLSSRLRQQAAGSAGAARAVAR